MCSGNPSKFGSCEISAPLPAETIIIIGAGHFGHRAARILNRLLPRRNPLFIIDRDKENLSKVGEPSNERILCDGIRF